MGMRHDSQTLELESWQPKHVGMVPYKILTTLVSAEWAWKIVKRCTLWKSSWNLLVKKINVLEKEQFCKLCLFFILFSGYMSSLLLLFELTMPRPNQKSILQGIILKAETWQPMARYHIKFSHYFETHTQQKFQVNPL